MVQMVFLFLYIKVDVTNAQKRLQEELYQTKNTF